MTTTIVVKTCETCPFYKRGVLSALGDALAKDHRKTGVCEFDIMTRSRRYLGLFGGIHIAEPTGAPPSNCPLRGGETTIKLAGGA